MKQLMHNRTRTKHLAAAAIFVIGVGTATIGLNTFTKSIVWHVANKNDLRKHLASSDVLLVELRSELAGCRKEKTPESISTCEAKTKEKIRLLEANNEQTRAVLRDAEVQSNKLNLSWLSILVGAALLGLAPLIALWPKSSRNKPNEGEKS
jgi:hypothetical protein